MMSCDRCRRSTEVIGKGYDWEKEIRLDLYEIIGPPEFGRPTMFFCRDCCIEMDILPDGYAFSKNVLSGNKIMIPAEDKGKPHLDPAYERYHCM